MEDRDISLANTMVIMALVKVMESKELLNRNEFIEKLLDTAKGLQAHEGENSLAPVGRSLLDLALLIQMDGKPNEHK